MQSKPDLVPDCDVHGEPMYRDESPACVLGLKGSRDVIVWRCAREGCGRYFHGTVGYRDRPRSSAPATPTPHCEHEAAFLVVQRVVGSYICPVAGCNTAQAWQAFSKQLSLPGKPRCSFCDRGEEALGGLIPSPLNDDPQKPSCYICAECVVVCNLIIESTPSHSDPPRGDVAEQAARKLAPHR